MHNYILKKKLPILIKKKSEVFCIQIFKYISYFNFLKEFRQKNIIPLVHDES